MMEINPIGSTTFRVAAIIICITCLFYTTIMRSKKSARNELFLALLYIVLIDSLTGIVSYAFFSSALPYKVRYTGCYICKFIYFFTHFAMINFFFFYIIHVCGVAYRFSKKAKVLLLVPTALLELGVLSNPLTHFAFYADENIIFHRGIGIYIAYTVSAVYFVACIAILIRFWDSLNRAKKFAMFYFLLIAVTGIVIQLIFPEIISELLCEAIGLMGLMIMIEREDDKIDPETKTYNRNTLMQDLKHLIRMQRHFKVVCVRIDNSELYRRIAGYENFNLIVREIAEFLLKADESFDVYRNGDAHFYIVCPDVADSRLEELVQKIKSRFEGSFKTNSGDTKIKAKILVAGFPEHFDNADDIILLSDSPLSLDGEQTVFENEELDFLLRNIEVERAISNGIPEKRFKVFYQPIYGKKCGCIKGAQALLKLSDSKLGGINYREFMPIAERIGFAEELEMRMIEAVFKFLAETRKKGIEMDFVIIHLMSVKGFNKRLVKEVFDFIEKYDIPPSEIAFDLNDSLAGTDRELIEYVITAFHDKGIRLFLGNYESTPLSLDSSAINVFEGVILSAWKFFDPKLMNQGDIIIKARANMLTQLGKKTIITGIDINDYYEKVGDVSGDYISGKYMSGPLSAEDIQERFLSYDRVVPI